MNIAYLIREDLSQIVSPSYYNLLPEFEKLGHKITVLNLSGKFGKYDCIKVFPKRFPDYPSGAFNKLEFSKACVKLLENLSPDLIFSSAAEYLYYLDSVNIPKIAMLQDEWSERLSFTPWFGDVSFKKMIPLPMKSKFRLFFDAVIQKKCIQKTDGIVFVNSSIAKNFKSKNKIVIPNALDFSSMNSSKLMVNRLRKQFGEIVLFLGRLELQKNPLLFVKIAKQLESKTDAAFLMVGDGEEKKSIEAFIKNHNVKNIELFGWVEMEKNDFLTASSVFVLPSLFDPCPVTLFEAMFSENAVVGSKVGGIKDAISHNENGLLCKNNDLDSFRNSVKLLLNHSNERNRLSRNAKRHVELNHSTKLVARKYLDFFEGIV